MANRAVGVLLVLGIGIVSLLGACDRQEPKPSGHKIMAAGLRTERMNYFAAEQKSTNWCWAACIQMVLSSQDIGVQQEAIVRRAFGAIVDAPASPLDVAKNLDGWPVKRNGQEFLLNATIGLGSPPPELLIKCLNEDVPMIVGLAPSDGDVGHAVVVTSVIYEKTSSGIVVHSIIVRDPSPQFHADRGKRKLSGPEFGSIDTYYLVTESAK